MNTDRRTNLDVFFDRRSMFCAHSFEAVAHIIEGLRFVLESSPSLFEDWLSEIHSEIGDLNVAWHSRVRQAVGAATFCSMTKPQTTVAIQLTRELLTEYVNSRKGPMGDFLLQTVR